MKSSATLRKQSRRELQKDSATQQLQCAQQVVNILFEKTGLSTIVREPATVIVGAGNWISFAANQSVSSAAVFALSLSNGRLAFVPELFHRRGKARSKTSPSLHLTNLDSQEILRGHVDPHYCPSPPLAHAREYLRKKTTLPSDLLNRLPLNVSAKRSP